ncbi:MAG: allantoicase [Alphaproteobacteria bacterium]|nr:allantoicase [Alphaproteobacteria bacterium]
MAHVSPPYAHLTDLLSETLGGRALACSDDFFASMHNLVKEAEPTFDPDTYYERGKVMDGWESRRKRGPGSDWCILALGVPGVIRAADLDTRHFTGNHAPWASLEACAWPDGDPTAEQLRDEADWQEILPAASLKLGSHNHVPVHDARVFTHVRLNIFPDGGVARLRLYGDVARELSDGADLAALENGGKALACSDMYFGVMDHLIAPGRADDMRGGWETRRRRGEGHDWVLVRLARRGRLDRLLIDTNHFKGNFPDTAEIEGIDWEDGPPPLLLASNRWEPILPPLKLAAHEERHIDLDDVGPFTHVRLKIRPCGGVSRLRVFGRPDDGADPVVDAWNDVPDERAEEAFLKACGSTRWARRMAEARPFVHRGELLTAARRFWDTASKEDLLEAFSHHPRIGEDPERLRRKYGATADLSSREQAGVAAATDEVLEALAAENLAYEQRFGHVFLVCATGRSAAEMLEILRSRMPNTGERELREAAEQQAQITFIRLLNGPSLSAE